MICVAAVISAFAEEVSLCVICGAAVIKIISICRGSVCVSDLWGRSFIGVCRGGVCVSDLCYLWRFP